MTRKTPVAIKSSKYSLPWPCKVCWCIELLRQSSAKSSSILIGDLASVWPTFSARGDLFFVLFFFPPVWFVYLSMIWLLSKSCLLPCTYSCPEGLSSGGASTHLCSLGELWILKIDRKLCSFPLVYFFEWQWKRSVLAVWKDSWKTISGCQPSLWKMRWALWCFKDPVSCVPSWNFLHLDVSTLRWDSSVH